MTILEERILYTVQRLPQSLQEELLDFAQFLLTKAMRLEREEWMAFSLEQAMRGMEEETSIYTMADLKVVFE